MEYLIFGVSIIAVIIIAKLFAWPFKKIFKLLLNVAVGLVLILLVNNFGAGIGLHIPFNKVTAIVSGLFGIPGVICLVVLHYIF